MQSEQLDQLFTALAMAQGEMQGAAKDCNNPFFKSKYADLSSVWNACREPLSKNGLTVIQTMQERDTGSYLVTFLGHKSGQYMKSEMLVRMRSDGKTNELQALGACITYLRRFALSALVGVAPADDDDGASGKNFSSEQKFPMISPQQATVLSDMLKKCPPDFSNRIWDHLHKQKVVSINDLPMNLYEPLYASLKNKLESMNESATG